MTAKFGVLEQTEGLHLQAKFHLNVFIVLASGGQKPQFWANFDTFGRSCTDSLLPMRAKFGVYIAHPQYMLTCQISSRSVYCVDLCWRKPTILPFVGLRHLVMSPIGSSLRKLHTGAQLQTFLYTTVSKLFLFSNEIGRTMPDVQKRDEQTNRQTGAQ